MRLRWIAAAVVVTGMISGLMGAGAVQVFDGGGSDGAVSAPAPTTSVEEETSGQTAFSSDECLTAADVYEQVRPSVVHISASAGQSGGTGTGVVVDEDGNILTNNHVISGARTIEVRFADGSTSSATIVGTDPANDLAVIHVSDPDAPLSPAQLGDSDSLRAGDQVLAIGNPFNLEGTLTQGIVSGLDRTYASGGSTRPIRGMIQTDAPINPGNSGGPLLNCAGEVIGINSLLENPTGQNVNVGVAFAVAINTAKRSLNDMLAGETVSPPVAWHRRRGRDSRRSRKSRPGHRHWRLRDARLGGKPGRRIWPRGRLLVRERGGGQHGRPARWRRYSLSGRRTGIEHRRARRLPGPGEAAGRQRRTQRATGWRAADFDGGACGVACLGGAGHPEI